MTMMTNPTESLIQQLVANRTKAVSAQIIQIIDHIAAAPFAEDLLEVDEPLWGGFWHFDVLGPGYTLPAVELALLRAMRLDRHWPEGTTVEQFLTDLRQAILQPQAGIWTLPLIEQPGVVIATVSRRPSVVANPSATPPTPRPPVTVVWYCATTGRLHAGYRADRIDFRRLEGVVMQRSMDFPQINSSSQNASDWLAQVVEEKKETAGLTLAARLDAEILRLR